MALRTNPQNDVTESSLKKIVLMRIKQGGKSGSKDKTVTCNENEEHGREVSTRYVRWTPKVAAGKEGYCEFDAVGV